MNPALLEIRDLHIRFTGAAAPAVNGINLEIEPGKTLGLVGESGSGKSVTALSILRLVPGAGISGSMLWQENGTQTDLLQETGSSINRFRGRRIGMIFQEPMTALNPVLRCGAQIAEAIGLYGSNGASGVRDHTLHWLSKVKIPDPGRIYRAFPHELSGGQKQRVLIAMAMCGNPRLLIADEPTTALDVGIQRDILELLLQLKSEAGQSMLFISHDIGVIRRVADTVAVMKEGIIVEFGPVAQVLNEPQHPYTRGLLACRPSVRARYQRLPTLLHPEAATPLGRRELELRQRALSAKTPLLQAEKISFSYPQRKRWFGPKQWYPVLKELSFEVYPGESFGVVGASGSGKTTLGRCIARQIQATEGKLTFDGQAVTPGSGQEIEYRKAVQMVFQDPYSSLNPRLTAGESVMEPLRVHRMFSGAAKQREKAAELLEMVGLESGLMNRLPHEFSGGQRQRICIARALAMQPRVLICDEISSALDVSVQATVLNLLLDLQEKLDLTYIFISHDLSVIRQMCDRVLVLKDGATDALDTPHALFDTMPTEYVRMLVEAVP